MPNLIEIGKGLAGPARVDVDVLLRTKLLLQANSGGGKSWLLRVLAEQLAGKVQTIIIDPEGEFSTLREKFDFFLVGAGGDTPARVDTAGIVAHKLLELGCSAVCDLYEMKPQARHEWVAAFLEAVIDAPKTLWHPAVFMVDEAHVFAPERGFGESVAAEGMKAMATRGRKRGFTLAAATQRLGKFDKTVAAELQNALVGPTFLDIDADRAMDTLGIARGDRRAFALELRTMEPGSFFALGRAISTERIRVQVRSVQSSHPEPGSSKHAAAAPPPPAKIRAILAKLGDLPKEAEEKKATEASLRARVVDLDKQVRGLTRDLEAERNRKPTPAPPPEPITIPVVLADDLVALERTMVEGARTLNGILGKIQDAAKPITVQKGGRPAIAEVYQRTAAAPRRELAAHVAPAVNAPTDGSPLGKCPRALLGVIVQKGEATAAQVSALSGYRITSSSFANGLGELRSKGLITGSNARMVPTAEGVQAAGLTPPYPSGSALLEFWVSKLGKCEATLLRAIFEQIEIDRARLSAASGYSETSSSFANGVGALRTLELVTGGVRGEPLRIADVFNERRAA